MMFDFIYKKQRHNERIVITILGIKIKYKDPKNYVVIIDKNNKKRKVDSIEGLEVKFTGTKNIIKLYEPLASFENTKILAGGG